MNDPGRPDNRPDVLTGIPAGAAAQKLDIPRGK